MKKHTPSPSAVLHRSLKKDYPVAVRGEGVWLFDADGRKILDFASSAVVNFIGHGDPALVRAIADQASKLEFAHSSNFTTDVAEQFAQELLDFAGPANYCPVLVGAISGARWGASAITPPALAHVDILSRIRAAADALAVGWTA